VRAAPSRKRMDPAKDQRRFACSGGEPGAPRAWSVFSRVGAGRHQVVTGSRAAAGLPSSGAAGFSSRGGTRFLNAQPHWRLQPNSSRAVAGRQRLLRYPAGRLAARARRERRAGLAEASCSGRGRVVAGPFKKRTGLVEASCGSPGGPSRAGELLRPRPHRELESQPAPARAASFSTNRTQGLRSCALAVEQLSLSQSNGLGPVLTSSKPKGRRRLRQARKVQPCLRAAAKPSMGHV